MKLSGDLPASYMLLVGVLEHAQQTTPPQVQPVHSLPEGHTASQTRIQNLLTFPVLE